MACNRLAIALTLILAGCVKGPERVDVSGAPGDLRFTVVVSENGSRSCVKDLSVGPVTPEDADTSWQISALDPDNCLHTFRYGQLTANITQEAPATPLRADVAYRVRMSGAGFSVTRDFRRTPRGVTVLD